MKALSAHEAVFEEFVHYQVMGKGTGLSPELSVKFLAWYEDSKSRSEEWIWRDQLMPAPSGYRREPPLL